MSIHRYPIADSGPGLVAPAPAAAGLRLNRYDATRCLYNAKPSNTLRLRAAVARARSGGIGRISTIGDSVTVGQTADPGINDPITVLARILRGRGMQIGETVYAYNGGAGESRLAFGGPWTTGNPDFPYVQIFEADATITLTSAAPGTVIELIVPEFQPDLEIAVDGGAPVTVSPGAGFEWTRRVELTGHADSTHSVVLTTTDPAGAFVMAMGVRPTSGLVLANAAISGTTTAHWLSTAAYPGNVTALLDATTPDCVYIELMLADALEPDPVPIADHKARMGTIINQVRAAGADVVLGVSNRGDNHTDAYYDTWISAEYDLADEYDLPLLDFADYFGFYADHLDMAGDVIHLNGLGSAAKAGLLAALIDP